MCGRYVLYGPSSRYQEHFHTESWPDFPDRYNIAPSAWVPVIRQAPDGRRLTDLLRWGLVPNWAKDESMGPRLNNARGETVAEKPAFRTAYQRRRCIVPAMGYYEWVRHESRMCDCLAESSDQTRCPISGTLRGRAER